MTEQSDHHVRLFRSHRLQQAQKLYRDPMAQFDRYWILIEPYVGPRVGRSLTFEKAAECVRGCLRLASQHADVRESDKGRRFARWLGEQVERAVLNGNDPVAALKSLKTGGQARRPTEPLRKLEIRASVGLMVGDDRKGIEKAIDVTGNTMGMTRDAVRKAID